MGTLATREEANPDPGRLRLALLPSEGVSAGNARAPLIAM